MTDACTAIAPLRIQRLLPHGRRPVGAALMLFFLATASPRAAADTGTAADSLRYVERRVEILTSDSAAYGAYVTAADELAGMGMYGDALSLLEDLVASHETTVERPSAPAATASPGPIVDYRITLGGDYIDMNDVVPSSNPAEERERDRLLRHQQVFYTRLRLGWTPNAAVRLSPDVYIGNRKAALSVASEVALLDKMIRLSLKGMAEKPFWDDYYTYDDFVGFEKDSSDMGGGTAGIVLTRAFGGEWRWAVPAEFEAQRYRRSTPAFTSFVRGAVAPRLEYSSADLSKSAAVECEAQYKNYEPVERKQWNPDAARFDTVADDSSDYLLVRPGFDLYYWAGRLSVAANLAYTYNRYPNGERPNRFDQMATQVALGASIHNRVKVKLTGRHTYEAGRYHEAVQWLDPHADTVYRYDDFSRRTDTVVVADTVDSTARLNLNGNAVELVPELRFVLRPALSLYVSVDFERASYPVIDSIGAHKEHELIRAQFLTESFSAWEPRIGLAFERGAASAGVRCSFRAENVDKHRDNTRSDFNAVRFGADASTTIGTWLSPYFMGDGEVKFYENAPAPTTNVSLSGGITARF